MIILSPTCFAVCGHHPHPRIAIVFSLLSSLINSFMAHASNFLIPSSNASSSSLCISHPPTMSPILYRCGTRAHVRSHVLFLPTTGISLSSFGQVQVPYTKSQFHLFRVVHCGRADTFSFQHLPSTPGIPLSASPFSPYFLALAFPFFYSFFWLCLVPAKLLYRQCLFFPPPLNASMFSRLRYPIFFQLTFFVIFSHTALSTIMARNLFSGICFTLYCHFNFLTSLLF